MSEQELHSPNVNAISNHVDRVAMSQCVRMCINTNHSAILFDQMPYMPSCKGEQTVFIPSSVSEIYLESIEIVSLSSKTLRFYLLSP